MIVSCRWVFTATPGVRMKASRATLPKVGALVTALVAVLTGGACSSDDSQADSTEICVRVVKDSLTGEEERVPDEDCERGVGGAHWYYYPHGVHAPSVGSKVSGGSTTKTGVSARVPASGGFGIRGGGSGGG